MKKYLIIFVAGILLCATTHADAAFTWADAVVEAVLGANPNHTSPPSFPENALGVADFLDPGTPFGDTFYNMGMGGTLEVSFSNPILLVPGIDLVVWEHGSPEAVRVRLADATLIDFDSFINPFGVRPGTESIVNQYFFDLGDSGSISSLTLIDIASTNGADIDAIQGLNVVPEPLAMTLFIIGGAPIVANLYRRRKKNPRLVI